MSMTQKEAVVNQVKSVLGSTFNEGIPAKDQLTDDQLKTIKSNITFGILNGTIDFKKDTKDENEISRYVSGMVSNHLRKAKELNGGDTYIPQSTGRGSRDPQISELNKLLKTYDEDSTEYSQIMTAIEARKNELASERASAAKERRKVKELDSIDMSALPEGLKNLASDLIEQASAQ